MATDNNNNKGGMKRFLDWVNADQNLPTLEELEHHDDHGGHDAHDDHGGHDAHDAHDAHETHDAHEAHDTHDEHGGHDEHGVPAEPAEHAEADVFVAAEIHEEHETHDVAAEEPAVHATVSDTQDTHAGGHDEHISAAVTEDAEAEDVSYESPLDLIDDELKYPDAVLPSDDESVATDEATAQPAVDAARQPVVTKKQKQRFGAARFLYGLLATLMAAAIIIVLLITVAYLPPFGSPENPTINEVYTRYVEQGTAETGAINIVGAMILDYRAFDTLGESLMLFTATMGVVMLIRKPKKKSSASGKTREEGKDE